MRKIILMLFSVAFLAACSDAGTLKIEVSNPSAVDKSSEIVEIDWSLVSEKLSPAKDFSLLVLDESGEQVPYQLVTQGEATPRLLIFPATVKAGAKAVFTLKKGKPGIFAARTFGRQVPERKDDFAWENDRVVFRMYGPALAEENPSNGVDFWLKRTGDLIVDKFYRDDLENHKSYHVDHGEGLDCYKVGHTLGAGGIAPYYQDALWVGNHYDSYRVLDNGPLRTSFELTYNSIPVGQKSVKQTLVITLDAHSQMNKAVVTCTGDVEPLQLAGGIYLHDTVGVVRADKEAGTIAYAENAVSDAGLPAGRSYAGLVFPAALQDVKQEKEHVLGISAYKTGETFTYYFGGGWSRWGFETDDAWFRYLAAYAANLKAPLVVSVVR
ncbi:MAG: DUF4861 domain-containing protein [Dysgonamonadaceae bacterium]|jgi:hypothetical protein|nr:DUF4861 domain-containing protein [Dysgonamonadaceae bacterium]